MPSVSSMFVNVLTPLPLDQDQVLSQAMVVPLRDMRLAQSEPVAPEIPHRSRLRMYGLAVTVSHWPQCADAVEVEAVEVEVLVAVVVALVEVVPVPEVVAVPGTHWL